MTTREIWNVPVPFDGTEEEARANFESHNFVTFDGLNYNCMDCDCKPWHQAAKYPCCAYVPRTDIVVMRPDAEEA